MRFSQMRDVRRTDQEDPAVLKGMLVRKFLKGDEGS